MNLARKYNYPPTDKPDEDKGKGVHTTRTGVPLSVIEGGKSESKRAGDTPDEAKQESATGKNLEIENLKYVIDLLNKTRKDSKEQGVYAYVFGQGSKGPYPISWINRSDLLEKFAVGKNGEPYKSTREAAHDLIEFLTKEAEQKIKEGTPGAAPVLETEKLGKSTTSAPKPESIKTAEEKNARNMLTMLVGKASSEDMKSVNFLVAFITSKNSWNPSWPTAEEKAWQDRLIVLAKNANAGDEVAKRLLDLHLSAGPFSLHITLEKKKKNKDVPPPGGPTPPPPPPPPAPPENIEGTPSLNDLRNKYLQAERLRGNGIRGFVGKIFGRKLDFNGKEMDFGGKEGAQDLEKVRVEYQICLAQYRNTELAKLSPDAPAEEKTQKMLDLMREEQVSIDRQAEDGIERNRLEKTKTWWRQHGVKRLGLSAGLMGGAFLVAGPVGFVATKTVLGTTGRYIGGQAALERYTKVLGDKSGLIIDIRKEIARKAKTGSAIFNSLDTYIASIPPDKIRQEAARLRMLQVEKGVSLDRLAISGDDGNIVALIMQRNNELIAQEAVKNARLNNNPALAVPDALSNSLALQINSMHEMGEKEIDKNRRKKMVRNFLAAAVSVLPLGTGYFSHTPGGGGMGGHGAESLSHAPGGEWKGGGGSFGGAGATGHWDTSSPGSGLDKTGLGISEILDPTQHLHRVSGNDNLWNIIEGNIKPRGILGGLKPGQDTYVIDAFKQHFQHMTPEQLRLVGISSGNVDIISDGDVINLDVLYHPREILKALVGSHHLRPGEIAQIVKNDVKLENWFSNPANVASLREVAGEKVYNEIIAGVR